MHVDDVTPTPPSCHRSTPSTYSETAETTHEVLTKQQSHRSLIVEFLKKGAVAIGWGDAVTAQMGGATGVWLVKHALERFGLPITWINSAETSYR